MDPNPREESEAATLPQAAPAPASRARPTPPPPESGLGLGPVGRTTHALAKSAAYELRREETSRVRGFAVACIAIATLGGVVEPLLGGDVWAHVGSIAALLGLAYVAGRSWRAARDPLKYTRGVARTFGLATFLTSTVLTCRLGVFSPAPMLTTLAVAFFGLGEDRALALGFTSLVCGAYAGIGVFTATGAIPDVGLVPIADIPTTTRIALLILVPLVLVMTFYNARISRKATLDAIARSNDWVREARQREVQLEEANRDLDQLLKTNMGDAAAYAGKRAGGYLLNDRIGRGAMGEVYDAKHSQTGSLAAVKLLHPAMQEDAMLMQRFLREGDAASKLRAPNVVQVYEVGHLDDGAPYIAMELLRGHDLAWHLRRRGSLSLDEVLNVVEQVGTGLEVARLAGVIHRDLKPQNLFLAQQIDAAPIWKILDFGVSRVADHGGTLTKDIIVGTPGYMSPEQAGGQETTHRSDLFSFGAVVYRALTGQPPFAAADTPQTLYQVVYRNPPRPSELAPSTPPDVDLALAIALAKDPADRYQTAREMVTALRAATRSALDPQLRLHARTLLAALPWGSSVRDSFVDQDELSLSEADAIETS